MIYFIIFCSGFTKYKYTKDATRTTLNMLLHNIQEYDISDYVIKIIDNDIVDDTITTFNGYDIYYTNNKSRFMGKKYVDIQLHDMLNCISRFKIKDDDFIVKIDYNCIAFPSNQFIKKIKELNDDYTKFDSIICYGFQNSTTSTKIYKCINNVYGMRCKYLKYLNDGNVVTSDEYVICKDWASVSFDIPASKSICIKKLGFYIHNIYNSNGSLYTEI